MWFPTSVRKVADLGYELLFKVGDDPLQELAEMDRFFKWSYRIGKLRGMYEKKRSYLPWIVYICAISLAFSCGILALLAFQYLFD
jgi:hypothetical protein